MKSQNRSKSKKDIRRSQHSLHFGSQRSAMALSDAGSQSRFYQIAQEKYSEDLKVKQLQSQVKDLKQKNQDQQKELIQERQKSTKLQDMVEKLIVKLKNYYSTHKTQPKAQEQDHAAADLQQSELKASEAAEKLKKSEEVRTQQKELIYSMRKEMLEMQKKIDELNEIKESGLLGG